MQEDLADVNQEVLNFSLTERVVRIVIHLVSWVASLGTAVAACAGVYFLSINNLKVRTDFAVWFWRCFFPHGYLTLSASSGLFTTRTVGKHSCCFCQCKHKFCCT